MLALDDPGWSELHTRSPPDRPVAETLRHLRERPDDLDAFRDLWPYLCSEDTPWPAAYAALPYLLDVAREASSNVRAEYLIFFGYLCECTDDAKVPAGFAATYAQGMAEALSLFEASFANLEFEPCELRYVLASYAALKGDKPLARLLTRADAGCPHCGEELL